MANDGEFKLIALMEHIGRLAELHGVQSIKDLPGAWEQKIDEHWYLAANGHKEPVDICPNGMMPATIQPYHFCVWFNGWIAGMFSPFEGTFAAGSEANEETLIEAINRHIEGWPKVQG